jgi:hypothetical protein
LTRALFVLTTARAEGTEKAVPIFTAIRMVPMPYPLSAGNVEALTPMNRIDATIDTTDSGTQVLRFVDGYGCKCELKPSVLDITLWLGTGIERICLEREHAAFLVAQLAAWLATGKFNG